MPYHNRKMNKIKHAINKRRAGGSFHSDGDSYGVRFLETAFSKLLNKKRPNPADPILRVQNGFKKPYSIRVAK
jgi:hypothetical protein